MTTSERGRARPWSARHQSTLGAQAAGVQKAGAMPTRPASAMDRLKRHEPTDPLEGFRKRNLYQAHARRLYSRNQTDLDEQLDMLAAAMKRGPQKSDHEIRAAAMAAHLSKHAREKLAQQQTQAGYAAGRRRPSSAQAAPSIPLHIASERAAESAQAFGRGASTFTRHEPAEVDAEQWLEHMWVAKRTKDMVARAQEDQVRRALRNWERERDQRDQAFENTLRKRMQLRGSTLPMGCKTARAKSAEAREGDSRHEDAQQARMERNLQIFEATMEASAIPGHPYRQHSASTAEQLRRPRSAAPVRRANSFKDRQRESKVFVQPPMRFAQAVPSHVLAQRRLSQQRNARAVPLAGPTITPREKPETKVSARSKVDGDDDHDDECKEEKEAPSKDGAGDGLLLDAAGQPAKGVSAIPSKAARNSRLAWDAGEDQELHVHERAARERAPSHRLVHEDRRAYYYSSRTGEELDECKRILDRFDDRGLAGEVSAETLHRALVTPQDLPFQIACKQLLLPGSTLRRDPELAARLLSAAAGKGKKKKGKKKAGGAKKKKKASGAASPKKKKKAAKPKKKK